MKTYCHVVWKQIHKFTKNIWNLQAHPLLPPMAHSLDQWVKYDLKVLSPTISNIASHTVKFNEICIYLPFRPTSVQSVSISESHPVILPVLQGLKAGLMVGQACYRVSRHVWSGWLCAKRVRLKETERFSPAVTQAATRELWICIFPCEEI